jgi:hypothetical protein
MRSAALLVLVLALPGAAFPVPKDALPPVADTSWHGDIDSDFCTLTFRADGTLHHKGATTADGTWKQEGRKLTWQINNFCFYEAVFEGEKLAVKARNTNNWFCEFTLEKKN